MALVLRAVRIAVVSLLAAFVGAGSAFAPEHVHERDDHHSLGTVHRHLAPHHAERGANHAQLDDDDHVIWLTTAWLQGAVYHGPSLISTSATWSDFAPPIVQWSAIVLDDAAPPHGPPRISRSPRAPPLPA